MADTSPVSQPSSPDAPHTPTRPHHKLILIILAIIAAAGLVALFSAMYNSSRNDGDNAADRKSQKVDTKQQVQAVGGVSEQQQSTQQPASDVGQETILTLQSNSTENVNTVQTTITYPADSLQFVSIKTGTAFSAEAATSTDSPGIIKLARNIVPGSPPIKGAQTVVTVTFKKLATVDASKAVTIDQTNSYLVTSADNRNLIGTSSGSLTLRP